jgi:hypothetical protein
MKTSDLPTSHERRGFRLVVVVLLAAFLLVGVAPLAFYLWGVPMSLLMRDPASAAGAPFYIGFLSQVGIFFWAGAATICLFCAWVLHERQDHSEFVRFLLVAALLTLALGFDDVFLLHDGLFILMGIPEKAVMFGYALLAFFWFIRFRATIWRTNYLLLAMALFFFAASIGVDLFFPHELESRHPMLNHNLFEDGAKLTGVLSWFAYFATVGALAMDEPI